LGEYEFERAHFPPYAPCTSQGGAFQLHRARAYVITRALSPVSTSKMFVRVLPVEAVEPKDLFICVESIFLAAVLRDGFSTRSRPNVAVAKTASSAHSAFSRRNPSDVGVVIRCKLRIESASQLTFFTNSRGEPRIAGRYIPSRHLCVAPRVSL
jgi:hypothetical protein